MTKTNEFRSAAVPAALGWASRPPRLSAKCRRDSGATYSGFSLFAILLLLTLPAAAADFQRGTVVRVAQIYLSPDASSAKLAEMDRGREIIIMETSREWAHVQANLSEERTISGWVLDKGVVRASTPNGDKIRLRRSSRFRGPGLPTTWTQRRCPGCNAALLSCG